MKVAVLMGGPSPEHDISILSGRAVHAELARAGDEVLAVLVTRDGRLAIAPDPDGMAAALPLRAPEALTRLREAGVEAVFLALHGAGGEDGTIQGFLDWAGMPYTGAGCEASAVAMNKLIFKALVLEAGLPTPRHLSCSRRSWHADPEAVLAEAARRALIPGFIKVASAGSSFGVSLVTDADEARVALREAFAADDHVLWEARVEGRELTVPLFGEAEGAIEALPVVEIRPKKGSFFDLASKYDEGGAEEICPAPIDSGLAERVIELAVAVHRLIGARGLSRTDFMVGSEGPVILETNTIPGLTPASIVPKALAAAGRDPGDFYRSLLEAARERPLRGGR